MLNSKVSLSYGLTFHLTIDYKSVTIVINDSPVFVKMCSHVSKNVLNLECFTVKFIFVTTI